MCKFNTKGDVWYSSEPFHCGDVPPGTVTYWELLRKVRWQLAADRRMAGWGQTDVVLTMQSVRPHQQWHIRVFSECLAPCTHSTASVNYAVPDVTICT